MGGLGGANRRILQCPIGQTVRGGKLTLGISGERFLPERREMSMKSQWWRWIAPPLFVLLPIFCHAGGKPEITQVNAQYLDNAVNINVHWQSPNPVVSLKVLAGKEQQEVKIDEYANKRNRRGDSGEATGVLNVGRRPEIAFLSY